METAATTPIRHAPMLQRAMTGRVAGVLFLLGGVATLVTVVVPHDPGLRTGRLVVAAVVAIVSGVIVAALPWAHWHPRAGLGIALYAMALVGAGHALSRSNDHSYSMYFALIFAFIGLGQPRWVPTLVGPLAALAYVLPEIALGRSAEHVAVAAVVIPLCVLLGEGVAWVSSQLRDTEQQLREREATIALAMSQLPAIVWLTDAEMRLVEIYGSPPWAGPRRRARAIGRTAREIFGDEAHPVVGAIRRALAGEHMAVEFPVTDTILRAHVEPLIAADGSVAGTVGITTDVTDSARASEAIERAYERERQAAEELRRSDELKSLFLEAVSHELRTPLTSVLGYAGTLERDHDRLSAAERADALGRLAWNARKLDRLLRDLLDLDRLARGVIGHRTRPTDVGMMARLIVAEIDLEGRTLELAYDGPVVAAVDAAKVERIIENLLANAIRHTPRETALRLELERDGDALCIALVQDRVSVPDAEKGSIFLPFRRGAEKTATPGIGIGLSLVSRFAELHGGSAWVEDVPGGGAAFRVRLADAFPARAGTGAAVAVG